ncbi:MAG: hypothetical protein IJW92_09755 [Clostridia bacterium]|nr:hypothetical protein [Clostridia bacterium]
MKHSKQEKIAYLFDEIGGVDDRLLQEAMHSRAQSKAPLRVLLAAACLMMATVLVIGTVLVASMWNKFLPDNLGNPDNSESLQTLDALLTDCRTNGSGYSKLSAVEEIDYFGDAYLVWQYEDDEAYYQSRALTDTEVEQLISLIDKGTPVGEGTTETACRVWLITGNKRGDVLAPYLPNTPGNVGAATLFDYETEILPSSALISCISDILNDANQ